MSTSTQQSPVVIDLAEVIVEVRSEMREEVSGSHWAIVHLHRIGFCKVIVAELTQSFFYNRKRRIDLVHESVFRRISTRKFRIAIPNISALTQHRSDEVLKIAN